MNIKIDSLGAIEANNRPARSFAQIVADGDVPANELQEALAGFASKVAQAAETVAVSRALRDARQAKLEELQNVNNLAQRASLLKASTNLADLQELAADVARPFEERKVRSLEAKRLALLAEVARTESDIAAARSI